MMCSRAGVVDGIIQILINPSWSLSHDVAVFTNSGANRVRVACTRAKAKNEPRVRQIHVASINSNPTRKPENPN